MDSLNSIAIVVTHNRCNLLKRCLKSLQSQSIKLSDILVIDNGSTDDSVEFIKSNFKRVKIIKLD